MKYFWCFFSFSFAARLETSSDAIQISRFRSLFRLELSTRDTWRWTNMGKPRKLVRRKGEIYAGEQRTPMEDNSMPRWSAMGLNLNFHYFLVESKYVRSREAVAMLKWSWHEILQASPSVGVALDMTQSFFAGKSRLSCRWSDFMKLFRSANYFVKSCNIASLGWFGKSLGDLNIVEQVMSCQNMFMTNVQSSAWFKWISE